MLFEYKGFSMNPLLSRLRPSRLLASSLLLGNLALLAACARPAEQTSPTNTPQPQTNEAEPFAAAPAAPAQPPSLSGIPSSAIAAAERAKAKVEVAATATVENGEAFRRAQQLYAEKKYSQALALLDGIPPELLTPAQEKAVADLRAQIRAAM